MTIMHLEKNCKETCDLKVKLRSGASVVKVKPLFTRDSKHIIVSSGSDVKIFNVLSGECTKILRYHKRPVIGLQENKQNHLQVFSCSDDGTVVRWDYNDGKILQVYSLPMCPVAFYVPTSEGPWFVIKKFEDQYRLYSLTPKHNKSVNIQMILRPVLPKENTLAFGCKGTYVASVYGNTLTVCEIETKVTVKHKTGERELKCIAFHPTEFTVATGDNQGRVLIWSNLLDNKKPIRSIYHWHTLPVSDLIFSNEGSHLFSGGGEAALVKWNLFSEQRSILPRLGSPICLVSLSSDNYFIITAHDDNALQIINSQRNVIQIIQGLTQGHFMGTKNKNVLPTGMLYDSRTKALVMNGRPGHLQFYNVCEDKQLFNLDISGRNFVSQEREIVILNTDVQKAAIDDKGFWLGTIEYWNDEETSPQMWLKFWQFDISKQTFILNTKVILPHNKEVNCIIFQPNVSDAIPLAVTTSNDTKFKVWALREDPSCENNFSWNCDSMGCYRDMAADNACFSQEGSLLAVSFGSAATLWTVDRTVLKAVLCHEKTKNNIKQLIFGKDSCCHLLVCHDGSSITVWNILSLSIVWIVHSEVQIMASDPTSDIIAAFCSDQTLIIFRPDNPNPIFSMESVSETPVLSAVFVPEDKTKAGESNCFHEKSTLFFINEEQNLLTLTPESEVDSDIEDSKKIIAQNFPVTPFGMLQAQSKVTNVEQVDLSQLIIDNKDNENDKFSIFCPTLQNPLLLCSSILPSLLIPLKRVSDETKPGVIEEPMDEDSDSESDEKINNITCHIKQFVENQQSIPQDFTGITDFSFLQKSLHLFSENVNGDVNM